MRRVSILLVLALAVNSVIVAQSISAQSTPKPSVPEFSLKYVDASHDVPPSYSTNPYTGENITHAGFHVDNRTILITIRNSNLASSFGKLYSMYYNVQIKGHNVVNWTNLFTYLPNSPSGLLPQSDAPYTIIHESIQSLPTNVPLDFRVQSFLVKQTSGFVIIGKSDWSNIQTISIPDGSVSTSPNPPNSPASIDPTPAPTSTITPDNPLSCNQQLTDLVLVAAAVAVLGVAVVSLLVYVMKIKNRLPKQ